MAKDRMSVSHGGSTPSDTGDGMSEECHAWVHHGRLLDSLHDALDGAERLSPLDDGPSLTALESLLAEAAKALQGLRGKSPVAARTSLRPFQGGV